MKIGIPNTLLTAYHLPYWLEFFSQLGMESVISDESRKETIDTGSKFVPHEFCIPIKALLGHVVSLTQKKVDLILVPRMINKQNHEFFCPKLMGLPEIVKYALHLDDDLLLSPEVTCNGFDPQLVYLSKLKIKPNLMVQQAKLNAEHCWKQTLSRCRQENLTLSQAASYFKNSTQEGLTQLGLLGYAYTLYDPFISKGIVKKLQDLGSRIYTWEMLESTTIERRLKELKRPLFWNLGRILLGAGLHFLADSRIDGVIYVTPFGCGPDSITIKLLSLQAAALKKPFLQIALDEHSEDGHLKTRLEAFTDMLIIQKEGRFDESHFSLPGSGTGL
jgi:predicted nucleotide-binding protein (sugar kinase/HSP70/actin superfamily)